MVTPTLPYYLQEIGAPSVALWTGVIISAQFAAVVVGNNVWGRFADKRGPHRAIQATMAGDAIFFGLSAAALQPWSLVVIRFLAGLFSPLVPALAYIFAVLTPAETTAGIGRYSLALLAAYVIGAAVVGASYDEIGWLGTSLVTAGVAFLALAYVSLRPVPQAVVVGKTGVSSGVGTALRSPEFVAHGSTAFTMGYAMNMILGVMVVELKEHFGFSVRQTSYVFFAIPAVIALSALFAVPASVARLGYERTIGVGVALMLPACALLAITPVARASVWVSIVLFQGAIIALSFQQNANQAISRVIGERFTVNGTGAVVGAGRTCWAAGQAVGPVVSLALYQALGHWAPWALLGLLQLANVLLYLILGVPLWSKPRPELAAPPTHEVGAAGEGAKRVEATAEAAPAADGAGVRPLATRPAAIVSSVTSVLQYVGIGSAPRPGPVGPTRPTAVAGSLP